MTVIYDGESSVVRRLGNGRVLKCYRPTWQLYGDMEREAAWLARVYDDAAVSDPDIVADPPSRTITMPDWGERVTSTTLPANWRSQADGILSLLSLNGCQHNDIRPENLLVLDDTLRLIDFQWATPLGTPPPLGWPPSLGGAWRAGGPAWQFDDRVSLFRSLEAVARGAVG